MDEKNLFTSNIEAHVLRIKKDADLLKEIKEYVNANKIQACFIMTCVGSLKKITIRLATEIIFTKNEFYQIASLTGNISVEREHIHISLSDPTGDVIGGHLLEGNTVYTPVEIVLGVLPNLKYTSALVSDKSGWKELVVNINN